VNRTWLGATYHSDSQLQTQGSPADNQGKHPKQAHPVGDRQIADAEALISSRSFHKMYHLESKPITKPKKSATTVSSDKPPILHVLNSSNQRGLCQAVGSHIIWHGKEEEGGSKVLPCF